MSETGTVTKVPNPGTRVAGVPDEPIEASKPKLGLEGVDPLGLELEPLSLERADIPFDNPAAGAINYARAVGASPHRSCSGCGRPRPGP